MTDIVAKRNKKRAPTSAGEFLRDEVLPGTNLSKSGLARELGISRQTVYDILDGKQPVTAQMAIRLGKLFGNGPHLWISMQRNRDLWEAEQTVDVSKIKTMKVA